MIRSNDAKGVKTLDGKINGVRGDNARGNTEPRCTEDKGHKPCKEDKRIRQITEIT